ncbi:MAG: sporulation transcription factor Spo0A [Clostridia bacterium]|nr:sporulation transcription factor Spo0A [Clostridia bacterium]
MDEIIRIILATENKEYGLTLTASLSAARNISVLTTTCDGNELVEYTKLLQPDIIIADLYLANKNCIAAYNEISAMNLTKKPALFLLLPYDNISLDTLSTAAAKVIVKPCDSDILIESIREHMLSSKQDKLKRFKDASIEMQVTNIMHRIGVPAHITGYHFLRAAILIAVNDDNKLTSVTKVLYPEVAKQFNTSASRVERAMRHAVEVAWDRGDVEVLSGFFGYTVNSQKGKPTNSEFISLIADHIRLKHKVSQA